MPESARSIARTYSIRPALAEFDGHFEIAVRLRAISVRCGAYGDTTCVRWTFSDDNRTYDMIVLDNASEILSPIDLCGIAF
jgi:hypothetical protein